MDAARALIESIDRGNGKANGSSPLVRAAHAGRKANDGSAVLSSALVHRVGNEATRWKDVGIDPVKAARKFWDRTRLREWMERLILTQAWNQESLKDGPLNSFLFLCARITNECRRMQGRHGALDQSISDGPLQPADSASCQGILQCRPRASRSGWHN